MHDLEEEKYIRYFNGHQHTVVSLSMNPTTNVFLSGSQDRSLRLWDVRSPHCQGFLKCKGNPIGAFDPEGIVFAAGLESSSIRLYDMRTFDKGAFTTFQVPVHGHAGPEWSKMEFSGDGRQIMITGGSESIKMVDAYRLGILTVL